MESSRPPGAPKPARRPPSHEAFSMSTRKAKPNTGTPEERSTPSEGSRLDPEQAARIRAEAEELLALANEAEALLADLEEPDQLEVLLDAAEESLDQENPAEALVQIAAVLEAEPEHPGAHFLKGEALRLLGDRAGAAHAYRRAALAQPGSGLTWASLALAHFEMVDLPEALVCVERALREAPQEALAWWTLSLIHEFQRRPDAAERCARHAAFLDPTNHPLPPALSSEELEEVVTEVLAGLPETIQPYLANIVVIVEDMPDSSALDEVEPGTSPLDLLGAFRGHNLRERGHEDPWSQMPPAITLYRRNLERFSRDREELIEELRITLLHEIGHFLGLEEDDLGDRGLD
jgi:predicted Zn-dependent protease with MMP-like domain/Flp pilus assembly protein TadD